MTLEVDQKRKPDITSGFEPGDDEKATEILRKWDGGRISTALFTEIARIVPQPIIEIVILRMNQGRVDTLLLPRPEDDIVWPGMVHTPGVALRAADYTRPDNDPISGALERIEREIGVKVELLPTPPFVQNEMSARGPAASQVYTGVVAEDSELPDGVFWHPVEDLPSLPNFIQHQYGFVSEAARRFTMLE